ncbi:type II toxin-antitoxin system PemK/MazF family toxin [Sandaracinobacter neustonicus]|uniref:Type II toxin-antitoxin system PemK/MazF family toxin n=1 Tax=Sandaracinobacter neustonicus TaxID=1715348 RepID=A0A501XDV5_9SPHN|nr:type II toxin-antitoxin system PemK/MazF family toxin [Sandaracinobacter neustonicus]TPE58775.1 type II toxin-antitoxin system PemK/MazF family toxin [Sandaracinobacter neustonicus]
MRRGSVVTVAGGGDFSGKPRPAIVIQADAFERTSSVTLCLLTTTDIEAPLFRIAIDPEPANGLKTRSWAMADKLVTVRRDRISTEIGHISNDELLRLSRALIVFLGLA